MASAKRPASRSSLRPCEPGPSAPAIWCSVSTTAATCRLGARSPAVAASNCSAAWPRSPASPHRGDNLFRLDAGGCGDRAQGQLLGQPQVYPGKFRRDEPLARDNRPWAATPAGLGQQRCQPFNQDQTTRSLLQVPIRLSDNLILHSAILAHLELCAQVHLSVLGNRPMACDGALDQAPCYCSCVVPIVATRALERASRMRVSADFEVMIVRASISLGRIAGIKVGINASVFLIVAILVAGLATGQLPAAYPGRSIVGYVIAAIIAALLFMGSLLAHELAHSLVARRNGIEVEASCLWLLGGVAQLKGEARTPGADFRIAIVGPRHGFALAVVFGLAAGGLRGWATLDCRSAC